MLITYIENMAKRIRHKMVKKLLRMYVKKKKFRILLEKCHPS